MGTSDEPARPDASVTAAGGWCAPTDLEYHHEPVPLTLPQVRFTRFMDLWKEPTPAERRANDALRAMVARLTDRMARQRAAVVDAACLTALEEGWDVHVYEPPEPLRYATDTYLVRLNYVGLEFTPAAHPVPTVHYHHTDEYDWEDD
jgi:hypothetical protein